MCSLLLISCAAQKPRSLFQPYDFNQKMQSAQYIPKVDNFLVVLDASGSMARPYRGKTKVDIAKEIVSRMNQTIPGLKLSGGFRTFGQSINPFSKNTVLIYGLVEYSRRGFDDAIQAVKWASGKSPMTLALDAAIKDLESAKGKTALIIVSDGKEMDDAPFASAQILKEQFGDGLCLYTVLVGDDSAGKSLMEKIAAAGQCGLSVTADQIHSSKDMANFVETVFLAKAARPLDTDGDGVPDDRDKCPDTPGGVRVDSRGCPLDNDGDGVYDYLDQCPDTPSGVKVDPVGCPLDTDADGVYDGLDQCPATPVSARVDLRGCWVLKGVSFDTGKSNIKPEFYPVLDEVVVIMKKNPDLKVEVQGHTDNRGAEKYNQNVSENRARSVMEYLVKEGIEHNRLSFVGYGFSKPAASNLTEDGRAQNRRVELQQKN